MTSRRILLFAAFAACLALAQAQHSLQPPLRRFTILDGLAQQQVMCFLQDSRGYLWLGTKQGLSKFDGRHFENFYVQDSLPGRHVQQLLEDKAGNVWAFAARRGCSYFDGVRWKIIFRERQLHGFLLDSMVLGWDAEKRIIWRLGKGSASVFKTVTEAELRQATKKTGEHGGAFCYADLQNGNKAIFKISADSSLSDFREVQNAWLATCGSSFVEIEKPVGGAGVCRIRKPGGEAPFDSVFLKIEVPDAQIFYWRIAKNGDAWFVFGNKTFHKLAGKTEALPLSLPVAFPNEWLEDNEGSLWLRSEAGLYQYFPAGFSYLEEKLAPTAWGMVEDDAGNFWISSFGHGLKRFDGRRIEQIAVPERLFGRLDAKPYFYMGLSKDHLGNLYFPHDQGLLMRRKNGQFINLGQRSEMDKRLGTTVFASLFDPVKMQVLAVIGAGATFYQPETDRLTCLYLDKFEGSNVLGLAADVQGNYWFVSGNKGVVRYETASQAVRYFQKGAGTLPFAGGFCAEADPAGGVWFDGMDGLYFYSPALDSFKKVAPDRLDKPIFSLKIVDSVLMIGAVNGLYGLNLNAFHANGSERLKAFNQLNGFTGIEPGQNASMLDAKGNYWLVCSDQIACIPKHLISLEDHPAKVRISQINRQRVPFSGNGELILPPGENEITVRFESIGFQRPVRTQFSWRLPGFRNKWSEWTEDQIAFLSNLPSGSFTFEVRSRHPGSIDSLDYITDRFDFRVSLSFWREPDFYKNAFFGGGALTLLGLILLAFFLIARRKAREEQRRAAEQERLAMLAKVEAKEQATQMKYYQIQTLLAQLNPHFLFNLLETIVDDVQKKRGDLAVENIQRLSTLMRRLLESGVQSDLKKIREGVHGISVASEMELLNYYVELVQAQKPGMFAYSVEVEQALQAHNVFITPMIVQPFVENAILKGIEPRLDDAGKLWVRFSQTPGGVRCRVEDNGIGREASRHLQALSPRKHEPLGTSLVAERVRLLQDFGVQIAIATDDRAGGGTVVTIDFYA